MKQVALIEISIIIANKRQVEGGGCDVFHIGFLKSKGFQDSLTVQNGLSADERTYHAYPCPFHLESRSCETPFPASKVLNIPYEPPLSYSGGYEPSLS